MPSKIYLTVHDARVKVCTHNLKPKYLYVGHTELMELKSDTSLEYVTTRTEGKLSTFAGLEIIPVDLLNHFNVTA